MSYKIKELADLVGISVRTLHHYDQIGLLKPSRLTDSGYRLYSNTELERLQQILFFKELDFNLKDIKKIIQSPSFDRKHALHVQKKLLLEKKHRIENIITTLEQTIDSLEGGEKMNDKEMFDAFELTEIEKHRQKYADEVKRKYGETNAYKESQKKITKYSENDWNTMMDESDKIYKKLASLMDKDPSEFEVQKTIAEWREHINTHFYTCTIEIFRGLGDLYVSDERFTKNIDKYGKGLARFMKNAMDYYCDMQSKIEEGK